VAQKRADACTNLGDFFGCVNRAIINVEGLRNAALVERAAQGLDQGVDVLGKKELGVAADTAGVVKLFV
jgi:hypothetical protein